MEKLYNSNTGLDSSNTLDQKLDYTSKENSSLLDSLKSKGKSAMKYTAGAIAGIGLMAGTAHSALIGYADILASYDKDTNTIDITLVNQGTSITPERQYINLLNFKNILNTNLDNTKMTDYVTDLTPPSSEWSKDLLSNGNYESKTENIDFAIQQSETGFWYFTGKDNLLDLLKPEKSKIELEYRDSSNSFQKGTVSIDNIPHGNGSNPVPAPSTIYTFVGGLLLASLFGRNRKEN